MKQCHLGGILLNIISIADQKACLKNSKRLVQQLPYLELQNGYR